MKREGGAFFRSALIGAALILALSGCRGASASASPSVAPSADASASSSPSSTQRASPSLTESTAPDMGGGDSFAILPAHQPSDFALQITCSGSIGPTDPVAIVALHEETYTGTTVLRDYADVGNPRSACTFGINTSPYLIDSRHIVVQFSTNTGNPWTYAVVDLPEVRFHWFALPHEGTAYPELIAVSPGFDKVAWLTRDVEASSSDSVHITTATGDQVVATLPDTNLGRCGGAEDSRLGAFQHAGQDLFVLDQPFPVENSLLVFDGDATPLSVLPPSGGWLENAQPAMPLWSPTSETLFYRQAGDIWRWTEGSGTERFLTGVPWLQPTISPDGSYLAYAVLRADSLHDTYLLDLAHGGSPVKIGGGARKLPVFVNDAQLWFKAEGNDHGCAGAESERPLIYSLSDGTEAPSIIDQVWMVWPATSSNF